MIRHWLIFDLFVLICLVCFLFFLTCSLNWWISCQVRLFEFDAIGKQDKVVLIFDQLINILDDLVFLNRDLNELSDSAAQKRGRIPSFFRNVRFHANANFWAGLEGFSWDITRGFA